MNSRLHCFCFSDPERRAYFRLHQLSFHGLSHSVGGYADPPPHFPLPRSSWLADVSFLVETQFSDFSNLLTKKFLPSSHVCTLYSTGTEQSVTPHACPALYSTHRDRDAITHICPLSSNSGKLGQLTSKRHTAHSLTQSIYAVSGLHQSPPLRGSFGPWHYWR